MEDIEKGLNNDLNLIKKHAKIIGADLRLLWDNTNKESSALFKQAKQLGFTVYGWTF